MRKMLIRLFGALFICVVADLSAADVKCEPPASMKRFLFFGVNPGEGFNLARDVYLRVVGVIQHLLKNGDWTLVLPPWGPMYHWMKAEELTGLKQKGIKWSAFFDVSSLNKLIPVVELDDFLSGPYGTSVIDLVCVLQRFPEGWEARGWEDKWEPRPCLEPSRYEQLNPYEGGGFASWFWGKRGMRARNVTCISFQGHSSHAASMIQSFDKRIVMLDRAENVLHDAFGDANHWAARRSMRFARHLVEVAAKFRQRFLNSTDVDDGTVVGSDWRDFRPARGSARGGPYLGVHLRRNDFLYGPASRTPSLKGAAERMRRELVKNSLTTVFLATDGSGADVGVIREQLEPDYQVFVFQSTPERIKKFHAGGIAIIDQIICSHARHFIGTSESTFSFRIQEEREILGFPEDTTFNVFCPDEEISCGGTTRWTINY